MKINEAWEKATLKEGIMHGCYRQSIDDDQVLDNGKAAYQNYCLHVAGEKHYYKAAEMEQYAKTW